jgi:hypothetical protein
VCCPRRARWRAAVAARGRGLTARCSLRSLDKVRQAAQHEAGATQRRTDPWTASRRPHRRCVDRSADCCAAWHGFLSPLVGAKALDRTLRLCPHLRPPGGRERHRLRCAPPVPGNTPQPGQAECKCSGWRGSCCQGWRAKGARASLDSAASPASRPTAAWPENGLGQGAGGHRWRSRWSRRRPAWPCCAWAGAAPLGWLGRRRQPPAAPA